MDNYLESLVVKGNNTEEVVPEEVKEEEVVEEIAQAVEAPEEPAPKVEEVVAKEPEEVPEVATVEEAPATLTKEEIESSTETTLAVKDIRLFNTPDPKGPFKIFSGNVIVKSKISDMTLVDYMKPSFGLVKGFTPDLK